MHWDVALRLPASESAEAGAGCFKGKYDVDAVFCTDELWMWVRCIHRRQLAAIRLAISYGHISDRCVPNYF